VGPAGGVSDGLETARSKGVLGFNGIKVDRMADKLCALMSPVLCNAHAAQVVRGSNEQ
jgi:hypothetical protein